MTPEELLKPRYEVIADYPENNDFPVGKIIEFQPWNTSYWQHIVKDCQGERMWLLEFFEKYPHLFKPLQWWERREAKDMPGYIKYKQFEDEKDNWHFVHVDGVEISHHFSNGKYFGLKYRTGGGSYVGADEPNFLPATIEEYNNYINSKK
jgi:hypothetical protein